MSLFPIGSDPQQNSLSTFQSAITSRIKQGQNSTDNIVNAYNNRRNSQVTAAPVSRNITYAAKNSSSTGSGVERWRSTVQQVLNKLGQPLSGTDAVLRRIKFESSGNPNAINRSDSNAKAGHPSQGLMQTIPGTFAANAGSYASKGITDPFASIYAGVNYGIKRYGSISAIDPLNRPRGY